MRASHLTAWGLSSMLTIACGGGDGSGAGGEGGSASTSSHASSSHATSSHASSGTASTSGSSASVGGGGGAGGGGGGGASAGGGATGGGGAAPADPCSTTPAACPTSPVAGYHEGAGLHAIDRCAFPLADQDQWTAKGDLVTALATKLTKRAITDVAADLNRVAVTATGGSLPGDAAQVAHAFKWESGDEGVTYWTPQGITGSADAVATGVIGGKKLLLVSWYYTRANESGSAFEKGVRLALVDVTNAASPRYRFLLLVDPTGTVAAPNFRAIEKKHAGGLAWFGDYLYVVDTADGLRVFDMAHVLEVATDQDEIGYDAAAAKYYAHGYKYVVPQVGQYDDASACAIRFSFTALDRTVTPPGIVVGEYADGDIYGRLLRYSLDAATGRLAAAKTWPSEAFFQGQTNVQGALSVGDRYWMSSSAPPAGGGALYAAKANAASHTYGWIDAPEDVSYDPGAGLLWSLSEALGDRYVFGVPLTSVTP